MKRILSYAMLAGLILPWASAMAQNPSVVSSGNGKLTFTNINPTMEYRVDWASRPVPSNQFNQSFYNLKYIAPTGSTALTIEIPLYYRVVATEPLSNDIYRSSDSSMNINMGTNRKVTLEWASQSGGPWYTGWAPPSDVGSTGAWNSVETPRYFRISFINCPSNFAGCGTPIPGECPECEWVDSTDPFATRLVTFSAQSFRNSRCMKIRSGQEVVFHFPFSSYSLISDCQDCGTAITNTSLFSGDKVFFFPKPGYYGYHESSAGNTNGEGMAGNIWVIP
ncbi:MAG: hypothetical protein V2A34_14675 [Lentisphaerota bacterium]